MQEIDFIHEISVQLTDEQIKSLNLILSSDFASCINRIINEYRNEVAKLQNENEILQEAIDYYNLIQCPKCGHYTLPQYICHNCGYDYTEENYTEDEV